jgi:hypothetical protein
MKNERKKVYKGRTETEEFGKSNLVAGRLPFSSPCLARQHKRKDKNEADGEIAGRENGTLVSVQRSTKFKPQNWPCLCL